MLGCADDSGSSLDIEAESRAIRARWDAFIGHWENKDASACAEFYTEDANHIPPNSAINRGRDEITAFYETLFLDNANSQYTHRIDQLDVTENDAVELGNFQVAWTALDSTNWSFSARSMAHWVRQQDTWMIRTFIFNLPK